MTQADAAGRKTDRPPPRPGRLEARLDEQLEILTDGMRDALKRAVTLADIYEDYGTNRSAEFNNAATLAKMSAGLVQALAKLNGQFNHDINVRHVVPEPPPPPKA